MIQLYYVIREAPLTRLSRRDAVPFVSLEFIAW